jgi:hypothetical protein
VSRRVAHGRAMAHRCDEPTRPPRQPRPQTESTEIQLPLGCGAQSARTDAELSSKADAPSRRRDEGFSSRTVLERVSEFVVPDV